MRKIGRMALVGMGMVLVGGCRAATRIVQEPRVDLELAGGGNRGYLVGTPPPAGERKMTRQMFEAEFEIPPMGLGRGASPTPEVKVGEITPPDGGYDSAGWSAESAALPGVPASGATGGTYVVKSGDTLWSIAADPQVFGDATKWRQLFEANQDVLKSPDKLRAGMELRIPRSGSTASAPTDDSESSGTTFTK